MNGEQPPATGRPAGRGVEGGMNHLPRGHDRTQDATDCLRLLSGAETPPGGRRGRSLRFVREQLSARDEAVLCSLASLRLMTTRQIERLHFREGSALTQARRCRATMERLHDLDLAHRLDRRVGGIRAGSASFLYSLSSRGRRLLDLDGPAGGRRRRPAEPSTAFQDHVLAVADFCVQLHEAERTGAFELVRFQAEPMCWRAYVGVGGERFVLKPDAYTALADGDFETLSFVEVDRGTEGRTTIRRKGEAYLRYAVSGTEQSRSSVFPRVVFLVPDERRAEFVRQALRPIRRSSELFVVGLASDTVSVLSGGLS
jgi:hypothetical protein